MTTAFRWLLRIFLGLSALVALTGAGAYWFASRSLPDYGASWRVEGVSAEVEIVRSNRNIPHIFGESDADVFFGLGFAHAQDRLWQMTMLRRTVQGRLSELFGARTVAIDDLMRRFDLYGAAQDSVEAQTPEARAALEAYAAGVNAWLAQVNDRGLGRGAPEFFLFSREIAPWTPADSLAVIKAMALQLTSQIEDEVLRAQLSALLPPERLRDILPDPPGAATVAMPDYASLFPGLDPVQLASLSPEPHDPLDPRRGPGFASASNAFAASPARSAGGGALLANDPHLGLSAPSIWYLARLELSSGGVIGGTIPGLPVVLSGRSDVLGWGLSTTGLDDQDLFIERLNPDNSEEYLTPEGWRQFRSRTTTIRVRDGADVSARLRWTENGPVLPGDRYNLAAVTPPGHVVALGWTALDRADTSFSAAYALMRAGSVDEALQAT
ncbi:MAG: penicillin acylase family protein, partial [Rhodobacteraceae bacterium]|nr:penicillin acylase family protein [Paracoccaceae bacterium]